MANDRLTNQGQLLKKIKFCLAGATRPSIITSIPYKENSRKDKVVWHSAF